MSAERAMGGKPKPSWVPTTARAAALSLLGACTLTPDPAEVLEALPETVPAPEDNPTTPEAVALGRALFWDPVLSGDRDMACASCHDPAFAYTDRRVYPVGTGGHSLAAARNVPTVIGTGWNGLTAEGQADPELAPMFWDNREASLEGQALGPIMNPDEMRGTAFTEDEILDEVVSRLDGIPEYVALFEDAYGTASVNATNLAKGIAAFERTIVPVDSSFDRYLRGDDDALTHSQIRGMQGFIFQGCAQCHSGPMLTDYALHNLGIPARPGEAEFDESDFPEPVGGDFRTPSLRMVTRTAPYMHNGLYETLSETLDGYKNITRHITVDEDFLGDVEPAHAQGDDMLAFLESLSDGTFDDSVPDAVPSGLPPGGE